MHIPPRSCSNHQDRRTHERQRGRNTYIPRFRNADYLLLLLFQVPIVLVMGGELPPSKINVLGSHTTLSSIPHHPKSDSPFSSSPRRYLSTTSSSIPAVLSDCASDISIQKMFYRDELAKYVFTLSTTYIYQKAGNEGIDTSALQSLTLSHDLPPWNQLPYDTLKAFRSYACEYSNHNGGGEDENLYVVDDYCGLGARIEDMPAQIRIPFGDMNHEDKARIIHGLCERIEMDWNEIVTKVALFYEQKGLLEETENSVSSIMTDMGSKEGNYDDWTYTSITHSEATDDKHGVDIGVAISISMITVSVMLLIGLSARHKRFTKPSLRDAIKHRIEGLDSSTHSTAGDMTPPSSPERSSPSCTVSICPLDDKMDTTTSQQPHNQGLPFATFDDNMTSTPSNPLNSVFDQSLTTVYEHIEIDSFSDVSTISQDSTEEKTKPCSPRRNSPPVTKNSRCLSRSKHKKKRKKPPTFTRKSSGPIFDGRMSEFMQDAVKEMETMVHQMKSIRLGPSRTKNSSVAINDIAHQKQEKDDDAEEEEEGEWNAVLDKASGDIYYYNTRTQETTWDKPSKVSTNMIATPVRLDTSAAGEELDNASIADATPKMEGMKTASGQSSNSDNEDDNTIRLISTDPSQIPQPEGTWTSALDCTSGNMYYYNTATREVTWNKPDSLMQVQQTIGVDITNTPMN